MPDMQNDINIIKPLAEEVARIAALPQQEEKRELWRSHNALVPTRPMVIVGDVWFGTTDKSIEGHCYNADARMLELKLSVALYSWEQLSQDMVIEPFIVVDKAASTPYFTIEEQKKSHKIAQQQEKINVMGVAPEALTYPQITVDNDESYRKMHLTELLLDGTLPVILDGSAMTLNIFDTLVAFLGEEKAITAIMDEPENTHHVLKKLTELYKHRLDRMEALGLLPTKQALINNTGAYTGEEIGSKARCKNVWALASDGALSVASGTILNEFSLKYLDPIFSMFKHVYYDTSELVDLKLDYLTAIPNLRKLGVGHATDPERVAHKLKNKIIFSYKANPTCLTAENFNEQSVKDELLAVKSACNKHGTPLEFVLTGARGVSDLSRIAKWTEIANAVAIG